MKKQVIVIGASSESVYAINIAKQRGYEVIAFDGNPDALGLQYADVSYVTDIRTPENITNLLSDKPDFVLPVPMGRYLTSTGAVNDMLRLRGISKAATQNCTDKYRFHQTLSDRHLRSNQCLLIPSGTPFNSIQIEPNFFPFILKPRYGSGSKGVYRIDTNEEFQKISAYTFPSDDDYIAETLFTGTEYGADGFVLNGRLFLLLIREKLLTNPPYCQCVGYLSLNNTEYASFYQTTATNLQQVTDALEMDNCIFHCDFMGDDTHTDVIEISARPSGHNLHNLFTPLATGVSMIDTYIDFMEGKPFTDKAYRTKTMLIGYFDFENCTITNVPSKDEVKSQLRDSLITYECHISPGYMETVANGPILMKRGYYILEGTDKEDLLSKRQQLKNCFTVE